MTLTFLGQVYEANSAAIAPIESELTGKYRGVAIKVSSGQSTSRSNMTLTYRGARYNR